MVANRLNRSPSGPERRHTPCRGQQLIRHEIHQSPVWGADDRRVGHELFQHLFGVEIGGHLITSSLAGQAAT